MYPRERLRRAMALYAVTDRTWLAGRTLARLRGRGACGRCHVRAAAREGRPGTRRPWRSPAPSCRCAVRRGCRSSWTTTCRPLSQAQADGVHVGQDDAACADARDLLGPDTIVGVSVQTVGQALAAQAGGRRLPGSGRRCSERPPSPMPRSSSLDELRAVCQAVDVPVVAIGGLNERTVPALAGTGVDGAAVVSALFAAADPQAAARTLAARVRAVLE